jgi:hypothetical protein
MADESVGRLVKGGIRGALPFLEGPFLGIITSIFNAGKTYQRLCTSKFIAITM